MPPLPAGNERNEHIALWGPTSAGKTWMVHALCKELIWYNKHDPEFHYRVTGLNNQIISWQPPTRQGVPATQDAVDRIIHFHREGKKETKRHLISSFVHEINIHDNKGLNLVEALHSPGQDLTVEVTLEASPYVIAVLDPTTLKKPSKSGTNQATSSSLSGAMSTVSAYMDSIHALCHFLSKSPAENKYLAVCVNKVDSIKLKSPPEQLIKMIFHEPILDLIDSYRNSISIKVFATSSVGHYWDRGVQKPNITAVGEIERPNQWRPCVAAPFFWILENKEKKRLSQRRGVLRQNYIEDYIEYPLPRPC